MTGLILASASPRRRELMELAGYKFDVICADIVETVPKNVPPYEVVMSLAMQKAQAVAKEHDNAVVVGSDTVVALDGKILGKPNGYDGAFEMLKNLSGKTHHVVTAIVVMDSDTQNYKKQSTTSEVTFENLTDEQIKYYIDNFKPFDKAGSYGIQEMPKGYIKSYTGDLENIIGISSKTLLEMLSLSVSS